MYKRRKVHTFRVQRISKHTLSAVSHVDFESEFKISKKKYEFPITASAHVCALARKKGLEVQMPPAFVIADTTYEKTDVDMDPRLYEHQVEGVQQIADWGSGMIADEMGVGKTAQALCLAKHWGGRVCVVCPSYLTQNWEHEGAFWGVNLTPVKKTVPPGNIVVSYSLTFRRDLGHIDVLILDESHYVKNKSAKCTKAIRRIRAKHKVFLSGTPAPNCPMELYSQVSMLRKCGTYTEWVHRYCAAKMSPLGFMDVSGASNKEELAYWLKSVMVRRLKRDVLTLPPKIRGTLDVKVKTKKMAPKFARWKEINRLCLIEETHELVFERKALVSELFLMTAEAKIDVAKSICVDLPKKTLVFVYHKVLGDACASVLDCIRIDGSTPQDQRHELVRQFQDGEKDYAVLSMLAAGTGVTLTRATTVIMMEMYFVPGVMLQAEDRAHRIGQKEKVSVTYVLAGGTLDAHMFRKIQTKLKTLDKCLDGRNDRKLL